MRRSFPALVASDMDGTFLGTDKHVPQKNLELLDWLGRGGVAFVPCSGRAVCALPPDVLAHPATRYAVASNGAVVYDVRAGQNLRAWGMDKSAVLALYEIVGGLDVTFDIFADGMVYAERDRYDAMGSYGIDGPSLQVLRRVRTPVDDMVPELVERADLIEKVTCFWKGADDRDALVHAIREVGSFSCASGHPRNLELQGRGVSKGSGIVWLCAYLGIGPEQVTAFGDEANDIPLLSAAGDGVAMANATDEVKAVADHLAPSNDEAGVARYLMDQLAC